MRHLWTWCVVLGLAASPVVAERLTAERLARSPSLYGETASSVTISPDGSRVTFLQGKADDKERLDLWEISVEDGVARVLVDSAVLEPEEVELDEVEKARRERQRIRNRGIIEYDFAPDGQSLLFPLGGDLHVLPLGGEPRQLTATEATEIDARFSPDSASVSFVRDQNLYVIDLETGDERALTTDGGGTLSWASADFIALEEMYRSTGYWWSPDATKIAMTRVDESPVAVIDRYEIGGEGVKTVEQRYPFAGSDNATVGLWVVDVATGETTEVDLGSETDVYLARVDWVPGGEVAVQRENRDQTRLDLLFADPSTGATRTVLTETAETWLNLHTDLTFLDDGRFVWSSERTGFRHLYLYSPAGELVRPLTSGPWPVAETGRRGGAVRGVDEERGVVFFEASKDGPLERHLWEVDLAGGEPRRVTETAGWHTTQVAEDGAHFVDVFEGEMTPRRTSLYRMDGTLVAHVRENALDASHPYAPYLDGHVEREFGTLEAEDGTTLHYWLMKPAGFDPARTYPAVMSVYGGPGAQTVKQGFAIGFTQLLAREGFVVLGLDNRGMSNRGKAFEDHIYRRMGDVEIRDQAAGARFLAAQPWVDAERIGIMGWSYGGYATLMALAKEPDLFAVGIAGAPVTEWGLYDTHYTERYLGDPADGDAYEVSDVVTYAEGIRGKLLIVHGMADDNVVFDHSVRLFESLQKRGQAFEMMTYPGKRHGISGEGEVLHLLRTELDFLRRHLRPEASAESDS